MITKRKRPAARGKPPLEPAPRGRNLRGALDLIIVIARRSFGEDTVES